MTDDTTTACPHCNSASISYRVKTRDWRCKDCLGSFREAVEREFEKTPPPADHEGGLSQAGRDALKADPDDI